MASVVVDRMLGVLSVLIMALLGLVIARDLAASRAVVMALGITGLACLAAAILIFANGSRETTRLAKGRPSAGSLRR